MEKRAKNTLVTLGVGLALNILLGVIKLVTGILTSSVSVSSDAVNNLSDAAVSIVTITATFLAARAADHDHPYGHGRYEYIAAFILGAVVVAVGAEVMASGIRRIITPVDTQTDVLLFSVLGVSIAVKAFMAVFYYVRGRAIKSDTVKAAAVDSMSDVIVTAVVLACSLVDGYTTLKTDGYVSAAISIVIIVLGIKILKNTVNRLLGARPDPELTERITDIISAEPSVISVHDLRINDYGASNLTAEADAVFPADMTFVAVHEACDRIERNVSELTGVRLCLHADPHIVTDARLVSLRKAVADGIERFGATAHDITVDDENQTVSLDIMLPSDKAPLSEIKQIVEANIRSVVKYAVNIHVDYI